MTPFDLLQILESRGVVLTARGRKLIVDAPAGVLTPHDLVVLRRHKEELLALLAADAAPGDLPPEWHLLWDERAAVMEYEGGLPRERAEALALRDILQQMRLERHAACLTRKEQTS